MPDNDRTVFDNGKNEYGGESTVYESRPSGTGEDGFVPGRLLLGTYRIESDPIHGGMGSVWRVHHTGWNTDLAMKRPQPQMFSDQASKQNFINECQSWINLGLHPNIVS
ncbi:MAG: hypothetical protein J5564_06395, partial [Clostridia bacterium]|nr:hypothetical protein [Clostridia bacterium]